MNSFIRGFKGVFTRFSVDCDWEDIGEIVASCIIASVILSLFIGLLSILKFIW